MNTDMVMAALNQAIADRNHPKDVIHHSDRGVQYLSIRYTDKMTDSGVITSVGTTGDSTSGIALRLALGRSSASLFPRSDNALAESVNGLYKTEVIHYLKHPALVPQHLNFSQRSKEMFLKQNLIQILNHFWMLVKKHLRLPGKEYLYSMWVCAQKMMRNKVLESS
jgi:transposase InsO family protein